MGFVWIYWFIFSLCLENLEEEKILGDLNEYYTRAILYEFDLSKRDESFILKLSKVIFCGNINADKQKNVEFFW